MAARSVPLQSPHIFRICGINPQLGIVIVSELRHLAGEAEVHVIDINDKKEGPQGFMRKVRALGIQGSVAAWIENWKAGRRQRVILNVVPSDWTAVSSGVPQGSVLGPLLSPAL